MQLKPGEMDGLDDLKIEDAKQEICMQLNCVHVGVDCRQENCKLELHKF